MKNNRLTEDLKKLDEATPKDVQNLEKRVNWLEVSQVLNSHSVQRLTDNLKKLREEAAKTNDVDIKTLTDELKKLREEAAKTKDVEVEEETDTAKDLKARVDKLEVVEKDLTTRVDHLKTAETTNTKTIQDLTTRVGKLDAMSDKRKVWFAVGNGHKKTSDNKVIFDDMHTNMGSHYDANTGIFTAPYKGAYFFTLAYKSVGKKINLDVYKEKKDGNSEYLTSLFDTTNNTGKNYMASISMMVDLEDDDKVYVNADSGHEFTTGWINVFSGFLVYPM
ncbi:uncharacterized protein LOC129186295 [Dunckerocampus dactyliophorus]|uniref:uncharacterized protein LOC129186295 n=1 Tax=Dunckerocampus dactyliophorus TaxID=161453 RepID=UPI0024062E90|nr:uncharacterized protein LOC129186295 [Dunckerocampus dactyliophorus]